MTIDQAAEIQAATNNVHIALREATQALTVAWISRRRFPVLSVNEAHLLCGDVAALLDAAAKLLRTAGLEVLPTSVVAHRLQALVQHSTSGCPSPDGSRVSTATEQDPRSGIFTAIRAPRQTTDRESGRRTLRRPGAPPVRARR
jgi:hypothetical protein